MNKFPFIVFETINPYPLSICKSGLISSEIGNINNGIGALV